MGVSASGFLDDCVRVCVRADAFIFLTRAAPHRIAVIPLTSCSFCPRATEMVRGINGESGGRKENERARENMCE